MDNKEENSAATEVTINKVNVPRKMAQYSHRPWGNRESSEISPNADAFQSQSRNPQRRQNEENRQLPRGSYTQIMVNPTQLSDIEFTAWMDRLVEARRSRQENKPRSYSQFRKPFVQRRDKREKGQRQQGLKHKLKPATELNTEELMTHMRCEYIDIEEAVDMYNLDVEECRSA